MNVPPERFARMPSRSPFLDAVGPLWVDLTEPLRPVYGLLVEQRHTNSRGTVHGGVLATLADLVLGYGTHAAEPQAAGLLTATLTVDFTGHASAGEWVEGRADVLRVGRRLAYARCLLSSGERPVASASGVFVVAASG